MSTSAYVSIFNDWDILPQALESVAAWVDEIIVVDGAYRWMATMLRAAGRDPTRSAGEVYQVLDRFRPKLRVLNGTWENELEKRTAGYAACLGRYVLRIDADEIMMLRSDTIQKAIDRGYPVCQVVMPSYVLPGWVQARARPDGGLEDIERQSVLFDSQRITAAEHLGYLWLVLSQAEREALELPDPALIDPTPFAFNAHLTGWRTPTTSIYRARFYIMKWVRDNGRIPFLGALAVRLEDDVAGLHSSLPQADFDAFLLGHEIVVGQSAWDNWTLRPAPCEPRHNDAIAAHYQAFLSSLALLNYRLAREGRLLVSGTMHYIDVSSSDAIAPLSISGAFELVFDQTLVACEVHLLIIHPAADGMIRTSLQVVVDGARVGITLPFAVAAQHDGRRILVVTAHGQAVGQILRVLPWGSAAVVANPYAAKPDHQFWRQAMSSRAAAMVDPVIHPRFTIGPDDRLATVGSCFAQHISRLARQSGFTHFVAEDPAGEADASDGVFSARYGNIYTVRQLWQLFQRAHGVFDPAETAWQRRDGRWIDPFRPRIVTAGFASPEDVVHDRERHFAAVRVLFETCDVLVITLGLTEAWCAASDGAVVPFHPGTMRAIGLCDDFEFHNFTVAEMDHDLSAFVAALQAVNPDCHILLTVSPVALIATYEDDHVLSATSYSKSALRVVAEGARRKYPTVDYFPSYELICGPQARGAWFEDDLREVRPEGVAYVMQLFARHYLRTTPPVVRTRQSKHGPNMATVAEIKQNLQLAQTILCDEIILDPPT